MVCGAVSSVCGSSLRYSTFAAVGAAIAAAVRIWGTIRPHATEKGLRDFDLKGYEALFQHLLDIASKLPYVVRAKHSRVFRW